MAATQTFTPDQLAEHDKASDAWMAINGKVYNVTDFLDQHPGGDEILLSEAGKDATEAFDDVGHSEDAREMLPPMHVGQLEGVASSGPSPEVKTAGSKKDEKSGSSLLLFIPVGIMVAYYAYQYYLNKQSQ